MLILFNASLSTRHPVIRFLILTQINSRVKTQAVSRIGDVGKGLTNQDRAHVVLTIIIPQLQELLSDTYDIAACIFCLFNAHLLNCAVTP